MAFSTNNQALAEFARNAGAMRPEAPWLLTDWDVWVKNPSYRGPAVRHPEDDGDAYGEAPYVPFVTDADPDEEFPF